MPEEYEIDTGELLSEIREHQRLTGTEPKDEASSGMTRRDLLVKGGVAAAAVGGRQLPTHAKPMFLRHVAFRDRDETGQTRF